MKTQMRSAEKMVRRAILEPGFLGRIKEPLVVVAMLSMSLVMVLVLSANANADPELTATRCIVTPDGVTPDSKFVVMVELHPKNELREVKLHEKIPKGWTAAPKNSAEAENIYFSESNPPELVLTWNTIPEGIKKVSYYVIVPSTTQEGNYQISGEIVVKGNDKLPTVGGEVAVNVKKRPGDAAKLKISFGLAIVIVLIILIPFVLILGLSLLRKNRELDKGDMRRAIAGTFVVGFTLLMMLSVSSNIYQKEVVLMYIQLVSVVVAFYFGAKVAAEIPGAGTKIETGKSAKPDQGEDKEDKDVKHGKGTT